MTTNKLSNITNASGGGKKEKLRKEGNDCLRLHLRKILSISVLNAPPKIKTKKNGAVFMVRYFFLMFVYSEEYIKTFM